MPPPPLQTEAAQHTVRERHPEHGDSPAVPTLTHSDHLESARGTQLNPSTRTTSNTQMETYVDVTQTKFSVVTEQFQISECEELDSHRGHLRDEQPSLEDSALLRGVHTTGAARSRSRHSRVRLYGVEDAVSLRAHCCAAAHHRTVAYKTRRQDIVPSAAAEIYAHVPSANHRSHTDDSAFCDTRHS